MRKNKAPSTLSSSGEPTTVTELLNKYGTYNIQPTADTENELPAIAQGLPRAEKMGKRESSKK